MVRRFCSRLPRVFPYAQEPAWRLMPFNASTADNRRWLIFVPKSYVSATTALGLLPSYVAMETPFRVSIPGHVTIVSIPPRAGSGLSG
jgi:hypothetical protein